MAEGTFVLKDPTSKDETLIFLLYRYNYKRLKYSTGIKIKPKFWNPDTQKAREIRGFNETASINTFLENIRKHIKNIYRDLISNGTIPTNANLKDGLDILLLKEGVTDKNNFIGFVSTLVENSSKKPNTIKHYNQTIRILREFKDETNKTLTFDAINLDFYEEFMKFCLNKNYSLNTIGGFIKHIKVFMNEAFDRKLTNNLEYKNKRFKTLQEDTESIYLTTSELDLIYKHDLSQNKKLDKVRDMFIISCYTGLRYSDLIKLTQKNLIDNWTKLKIKTEKTGEIVIIPLHKYIREILVKYDGFPLYEISNQKMNNYLKELGKLVKLNKSVSISTIKGGIKKTEHFKKHDLITVHTARRSFATNAFLMEIPSISIMKITGHRTEKAFLKYIKISQEENANKLLNHPFFTQNN